MFVWLLPWQPEVFVWLVGGFVGTKMVATWFRLRLCLQVPLFCGLVVRWLFAHLCVFKKRLTSGERMCLNRCLLFQDGCFSADCLSNKIFQFSYLSLENSTTFLWCVLPQGTSQFPVVWTTRFFYYLPCSSFKVMVHWSHTSVGPKYWIGPGYTKQVFSAHSSRCAANSLKGAPSKRTNALRITGFISPLRRSMFIIIVIGTPPAFHSSVGAVVFLTIAI